MNDLAIVIPAYKPDYLRETLDSLLAQTDRRFNVYVGDDSSPHDIASVINEYEGKMSLTYHRFNTNLGGMDLVAQWERCIALTSGEKWLWLFSDDDVMGPDCVEAFHRAIEKYPAGELFHFNINMIDDLEGGIIKPMPVFPANMSAGEFLEAKLRGRIVSYVVEFIFSRHLYEKTRGFENFDLAWGSDFMTWLKMAADAPGGIITIEGEGATVNWRRSASNISPDKSHPILVRKLRALIDNASFIKQRMTTFPEKYAPLKYSFRWIRFPLGEIFRNRKLLTFADIMSLLRQYISTLIAQ